MLPHSPVPGPTSLHVIAEHHRRGSVREQTLSRLVSPLVVDVFEVLYAVSVRLFTVSWTTTYECVDMSGKVAEDCQEDVEDEIRTAA